MTKPNAAPCKLREKREVAVWIKLDVDVAVLAHYSGGKYSRSLLWRWRQMGAILGAHAAHKSEATT